MRRRQDDRGEPHADASRVAGDDDPAGLREVPETDEVRDGGAMRRREEGEQRQGVDVEDVNIRA